MGAAKLRGTLEQRVAQSVQKREAEEAEVKRLAQEKFKAYQEWFAGLTEEERVVEQARLEKEKKDRLRVIQLMALSAVLGKGCL